VRNELVSFVEPSNEFGNDVHASDADGFVAWGFLNHILVEPAFGQECRASPSQIMDGERVHFERQAYFLELLGTQPISRCRRWRISG
jgi:hypothetical protein